MLCAKHALSKKIRLLRGYLLILRFACVNMQARLMPYVMDLVILKKSSSLYGVK